MLKYVILGTIQGITEFLPVSSSGHLVIVQNILGISSNQIALTVVLHLGTICALVVFFFKDILKTLRNAKMLTFILIVTLITGIIGILGRDFFERLFSSAKLIALTFLVTGIVLIFTKKFMNAKRDILGIGDAIILGIAQAIAIIPGISRSGITISSLLSRGVDKETCFKFSFLASIPAVVGATILKAKEIDFALKTEFINFVAGFIFSFLSGVFSLWMLKKILLKAKFYYFGYYCIFIAIITLLFIK